MSPSSRLILQRIKNVFTKYSPVLGLICWSCHSQADQSNKPIDVISVEYPPFTTTTASDFGISHRLLDQFAKQYFKTQIRPVFLPPARAQFEIAKGNWCLSFYPPDVGHQESAFVQLSDEAIKLGMYRIHRTGPFTWQHLTEFAGKSVAMLRSDNKRHHLSLPMVEAGMKITNVKTVEQGLRLLLLGRVDYAFGDNTSLDYLNFSDNEKVQLQFSAVSLSETNPGFFYNFACKEKLFNDKFIIHSNH